MISLRAYDDRWPASYRAERTRILAAVRPIVAADGVFIEHVGSTAVPGLAAKPVIDIMLGLPRLADADRCIPSLERIGYEYRPDAEAYIPDRRYLEKRDDDRDTHHLHVVERSSTFWENQLLFRDALREDAGLAAGYARLKEELAGRFGADRIGYALAKSDFVDAALRKARRAAGRD